MINGRDIAVLAALSMYSEDDARTIRALSGDFGIPHAGIQRSLARLSEGGLYLPHRGTVVSNLAVGLFSTAARFLVPPQYLGQGRGMPTAWYGGELTGRLHEFGGGVPIVWPTASGEGEHGVLLKPVDPAVPKIAEINARAGDLLRAVDICRIGGAREIEVAHEFIENEMERARWRIE